MGILDGRRVHAQGAVQCGVLLLLGHTRGFRFQGGRQREALRLSTWSGSRGIPTGCVRPEVYVEASAHSGPFVSLRADP